MAKVAYFLNGPQKLDWAQVEELKGLPADTIWLGLDDQFQSSLADEEWGGDLNIFRQRVVDASRASDTLVIFHANIEKGRHWAEFALKTGLIANTYRCVILSRWLSDYTTHPQLPVGNWEIRTPFPSGWDSPVAGSPSPLFRLPDTHDNYYL